VRHVLEGGHHAARSIGQAQRVGVKGDPAHLTPAREAHQDVAPRASGAQRDRLRVLLEGEPGAVLAHRAPVPQHGPRLRTLAEHGAGRRVGADDRAVGAADDDPLGQGVHHRAVPCLGRPGCLQGLLVRHPGAARQDAEGEVVAHLFEQAQLGIAKAVRFRAVHGQDAEDAALADEGECRRGGEATLAGFRLPEREARVARAHHGRPTGADGHAARPLAVRAVTPAHVDGREVALRGPGPGHREDGAFRAILRVSDPGEAVAAHLDRDVTDLVEQGRLVGRPHQGAVDGAQRPPRALRGVRRRAVPADRDRSDDAPLDDQGANRRLDPEPAPVGQPDAAFAPPHLPVRHGGEPLRLVASGHLEGQPLAEGVAPGVGGGVAGHPCRGVRPAGDAVLEIRGEDGILHRVEDARPQPLGRQG
jgi:hypothetical protein